MWRLLAASMVGMSAAAVLAAPTPTTSVDATPVLTTTPFGALPGQQVTHTVTVAGTASLTAGRITFTTTADLEEITVRAEPGRCSVSSSTVVCDLGDVRLAAGAAPPRVTITGRIRDGAAPSGLVRNRVTLTAAEFTDDEGQVASNAYLLPGSAPTSAEASLQAVATEPAPPRRASLAVALSVLGGAVLAVGLAVLTRRRRRPGDGPPQVPPPVAAGGPDTM